MERHASDRDRRSWRTSPTTATQHSPPSPEVGGGIENRHDGGEGIESACAPDSPPRQSGVAYDSIAGPADDEISPRDRGQVADHAPPPSPPPPPATAPASAPTFPPDDGGAENQKNHMATRLKRAVVKFASFVGPGFMIAVAYIDPGNYATDIAAGASYRFQLLFVVLLANLFAIFLQSLAIKLGTVTGLDLAEACRVFLPRWLNWAIYGFAEVGMIATDIAEVIGFAIALNLLAPQVPLVAGCAISIADVMFILVFYRPEGSMRGLRIFEIGIGCLVLGVVVCFCIQMSLIRNASVGEVFRGYLPSAALAERQSLYQACGILGATVMPHSLYLGSGMVQPRLREYDSKRGLLPAEITAEATGAAAAAPSSHSGDGDGKDRHHYVPSLAAIRHGLRISTAELAIALFTFALFVNSAILIVAGASLYHNADALEADIFGIHGLLSESISPAAGTIFALALLLSGISAGIVATIAGQMVSEGALNWKVRPWVRRLLTRTITVTPSIIIAGAIGRSGLNGALMGSQVALSVILPFVSAPLIYFTCRAKYMTVRPGPGGQRLWAGADRDGGRAGGDEEGNSGGPAVEMSNSWYTVVIAVLVWLFISGMNVANLALLRGGGGG